MQDKREGDDHNNTLLLFSVQFLNVWQFGVEGLTNIYGPYLVTRPKKKFIIIITFYYYFQFIISMFVRVKGLLRKGSRSVPRSKTVK